MAIGLVGILFLLPLLVGVALLFSAEKRRIGQRILWVYGALFFLLTVYTRLTNSLADDLSTNVGLFLPTVFLAVLLFYTRGAWGPRTK